MIIYSELTDKTYGSVDECLSAEKEYKSKKEEEAKARKAHEEEREKAYEEAIAACDRYLKLSGIEVNCNKVSTDADLDRIVNILFDNILFD